MTHATALLWFRRDLRIAENPALARALRDADSVAPLYVWPRPDVAHAPGPAGIAWLAGSLDSLARDLAQRGSSLAQRPGPAPRAIAQAAAECGATLVTCTRDWSPSGLAEERAVAAALSGLGIEFAAEESQLLVTPPRLTTKAGQPYSVFTPYWRAWRSAWAAPGKPQPAPGRLNAPARPLAGGEARAAVGATWAGGFDLTAPGEAAASARLERFAAHNLLDYAAMRDIPSADGTSALSAHLAFGSLSPAQVLAAVGASPHAEAFVRQLAWREFAYHVAHAQPELLDSPIKAGFSAMGWHEDPEAFEAWSRGMTGFPMVDAGMRQLEATGWMHNRVRLLTASLLTKHLLVRWQDGATFFERSLVDLDPVLNAFNWQWVAGSGADAAPYFRVFNPVVQGERFDTDGAYIRRWVPELAELPARWIQKPWLAPADVLRGAGVKLGVGYPAPIVDLAEGRVRALAAFAASKTSRD